MRAGRSRVGTVLFGALCLLLAADGAAAASWSVRTITAQGDVEARFPWVVGADAAVAERINTLLFLDLLETPPPRGTPATFVLPPGTGALTPVRPGGFRVLRQDERVLSIAISAEGCGAYCEDFERAYVFDLATGRQAPSAQLLSVQGRQALARKGGLAFAAAIDRTLAEVRKRKDKDFSADDRATLRGVYEECRTMVRGWIREGRLAGMLYVEASGAKLVFERCTPHAIRALDELGDFSYGVEAADLAAALSPYGRALLLGQGDARAPADPDGQVFSGSVGGAAIRLYTRPREADGSLGGTYFYERYRKPIGLSGRVADGVWTLSEGDDPQAQAEWSLKRQGTAWVGTWTGAGDGRQLPVRLAP